MAQVERSGRGPRALAALMPKLAEPAIRKRGFAGATLLARWHDVVGASLAADAVPDRLVFPRAKGGAGTLHVRVTGPAALELQHLAPQVIERINGFFGYAAVGRIVMTQGPVEPPPPRRQPEPPRPVPRARAGAIDRAAAGITDEDLRSALTALGRAVAGARSQD